MGRCHLVLDTAVSGRSWGGFRVTENLSLDEVRVLARTMTVKTILAGIPMGGAKGGISLSTSEYDKEEMLRLAADIVGPYLRRHSYFLGTDLGFTESDANSVYKYAGSDQRLFSGRITVGEACAVGIAASLEYVQRNGLCRLQRRTVALEGFGRIGSSTAKLLSSEGYNIVAVSNLAGTLSDPHGLNVDELSSIPAETPQSILSTYSRNHPTAVVLPREQLAIVESDILIPGARALVVDEGVAGQVKAKIVCPISNAPITVGGEHTLAERGIVSIPDIISNAGGLIGSFAQHLGAGPAQTRRIISDITMHNLDSVFGNLPSHEVPKKVAVATAMQRLSEFRKSERIGMVHFLSPWIRNLGLNALLYGFKEYLGLNFGG